MKPEKVSIFILMLVLVLSLGLAGCSTTEESDVSSGASDQQPTEGAIGPGEVAGFEEFPIGDDIELGPLNVAGVYFQPVDMEPAGKSLPASESDMHLEADISALPNDLGYGVGDFVPYLTVRYELEKEDGTIIEGNFMPMSASDGPHYGANVKFGEAGTYKVRFIIENPEAQGYLLHVDQETGVTGRFWTEPLVAEWEFDYVPRVW
ncbi:MAG TPA: iron transporter [Anaerolineaceae bacterium]|nr:iron transporter [Anaerolineaceae bacterium]